MAICDAARASRPGLAVGALRVFYAVACARQSGSMLTVRSKKCRVGCPGEPDSLTHYDKCPLSHNIIIALRRNAAVSLRRDRLSHDLITRTL